jgi:hypothetical protein
VRRLSLAFAVFLVLGASSPAMADNLFFTPFGVDLDTYGGPVDPVPIGSEGFRLTFNGGGKKTVVDPVLLILGIPTGASAPTLTPVLPGDAFSAVVVDPGYSTSPYYGGSWDTTTGFAGNFNSSSPANVYAFIGLDPDGVDSQNYTNWTGSSPLTSWDIYVYGVTFTPDFNATNHDWIDFSSTPLPGETYVAAYGCLQVVNGHCLNESKTQSTPFTRAGHTTGVPEPSSMLLLGSGLAAVFIGGFRQRQKKALLGY